MENNEIPKEKKTRKSSARVNKVMGRAIRGRFISTDFFSRHWITVALLTLMFVWYMTNKYECRTNMETIQKLEKQLERDKTERIREQSLYMSRIRESSMMVLVRRNNLDLQVQENPPYKIKYSSSQR